MATKFYKLDPYEDPDYGYAAEAEGPGPGVVVVEVDEAGLATRAVYLTENAEAPVTFALVASAPVDGRRLAGALVSAWGVLDPQEPTPRELE